jgi:ELWxxDGT repeat protein
MGTKPLQQSVTTLLLTLSAAAAAAAPFHLIKDVYSGPTNGTSYYLVADDAKLFFWGYDSVSGTSGAPWLSAGTASGTDVIKQINGSSGLFSVFQPHFANNGIVYFVDNDGFFGNQVWRSDGTSPGTFALTSTTGGIDGSQVNFTALGNLVIFEGGSASQGYALQVTDGTLLGTQALSTSIFATSPGVILNGRALFPGSAIGGYALVTSDGTPAGTASFGIIGLTGFSPYAGSNMVAVNDVVYFVGTDSAHGTELWKTDGTQIGTMLVKDIFTGMNSSYPQLLTRVDDRLFFIATTPDAGQELWTSDGSDTGTERVKDIRPGLQDSSPAQLTALNGIVYFVANDGTNGKELWRSDGTDPGTSLALGDFNTMPGFGAFDYAYDTVQAVNHKLALVLGAPGASYFDVPYVSDGTLAGTQPMDSTQTATVFYSGLAAANGKLFASGAIEPSNYGNELIATDAFATLGNTWCANPEQPIPDVDATGMTSHFHLPSYGGITKLTVSVDIGHTHVGDLQIKLRHEQTATEVVLFDQPVSSGDCSGALLDIVLDDSAATSVQTACANTRPAYARDQSFHPANPLSGFNGQSLKGDWTMTLTDNASGNIGILHEWCVNFATDLIFTDSFD